MSSGLIPADKVFFFFVFFSQPKSAASQKHTYIILTPLNPLKPHFYVVKLAFTGVYIIFLISAQKRRFRALENWKMAGLDQK